MSGGFADVVRSLEDGSFAPDPRTDVDTASLLERHPTWARVETTDVTISGRHGDIRGRLYRLPTDEPQSAGALESPGALGSAGALVWAHGGSWVGGDLDMPEANAPSFALAAAGIPVLSIDYRKALGGVHFPVPSDDVLDAWKWAVANPELLGVAADRLHLGGASAGGDLVAGVALRLQHGEGRPPASVVLVYPLVHPELPPLSDELASALEGHDLGFDPESVREMTLNYVGDPGLLSHRFAFAANGSAADLAGLPPVFVLNSHLDLLRASGEAFAHQLRDAGVTVRLYAEVGAPHGHLDQPHSEWFRLSVIELVGWLRSFPVGP